MSGPIGVFGAAGQFGRDLADLAARMDVALVGWTRAQVDITDSAAVAAALSRARPRLIVNAAAYTAVDKAESEPELAFAANEIGPGVLAQAAARAGAPIVHVSTDYVFDGTKIGAYVEDDAIAPLGVYGKSKAAGEARVRAAAERHLILRTSWLYGAHGANFLKTMLRLARERDELRVVCDQRGCPTSTIDLAQAVLAIDRSINRGAPPWGTFHFAGTGATTWHDFANEIVDAAGKITGRRPRVVAIATKDYPTIARRPANSELDSAPFSRAFNYAAAPWRLRVRELVERFT